MRIKLLEYAVLLILVVKFGNGQVNTEVKAFIGDYVKLPCVTENLTDVVEVMWIGPDGSVLNQNEDVSDINPRFSINWTDTIWFLEISDVHVEDRGSYKCHINSTIPVFQTVDLIIVTDDSVADDPTNTGSASTTATSEFANEATTANPDKCSDFYPCLNGGSCTPEGVCQCAENFTGQFCNISLICPAEVCNINNTATCQVLVQQDSSLQYKCTCLALYRGKQCEVYDICLNYPCYNRGVCSLVHEDLSGEYTCKCVFGGDESQNCRLNEEDDCVRRPPDKSDSYVTCIDKIGQLGSIEMVCAPGYKGTTCRTKEQPSLYCSRFGKDYCADEGYCKPLCNFDICNGTKNCNFSADPYNTTGFVEHPGCVRDFANGYDFEECHSERTLFDGLDTVFPALADCSPYFNTVCTKEYGNGECKPECSNDDCLFDGFDCYSEELHPLPGVVVMELLAKTDEHQLERNISMMLRSHVNNSLDGKWKQETKSHVYSLKISYTNFTSVTYAGKYLAAVIAKKPYWLDGAQVKDVFVCEAGSYSSVYPDKCTKQCSTCIQRGEVCDWRTGECLHGCPPGHWGDMCKPCDTCKQEGDVCNSVTGICLHGCISNEFYGPNCRQCNENCIDGCNSQGICNNCSSNRFGDECENECDEMCMNDTCDRHTGWCDCGTFNFWSQNDGNCQLCSNGCNEPCKNLTGACKCRPGYYDVTCTKHCNKGCLNYTCSVDGTCDMGCHDGHYGNRCEVMCHVGCNACVRETGDCVGDCKPGYQGKTCANSSAHSGGSNYIEETTDTTGIIIGVVISLIIIVLILIVACCYWRRRQTGDYVMEDEEREPEIKRPIGAIQNNLYMQPTALPGARSADLIELDDKQDVAAVYAGPGRDQKTESEHLLKAADNQSPEEADDTSSDESEDIEPPSEHTGSSKQHKSSVLIEVGSNGRVLSISSEGGELESPKLPPAGEENSGDDSAFHDSPPHSPLAEARAPLASEEDLLASLEPAKFESDTSDKPAGFDEEGPHDDCGTSEKSESKSSSSKTSSRKSSSSSSSSGNVTTEM